MNILKHLPKKETEVLAQGLVPESLLEKVNRERKRLKITWNELFIMLFESFLEEVEKKK